MGQLVEIMTPLHRRAARDYRGRLLEHDKAECAEVACRFDRDYWDGDRKYGYGGYREDGRWGPIARQLVERYRLKPGARILDVGCGKGYLLNALLDELPGCEVRGLDVSEYAIAQAPERVRARLVLGRADRLPFETGEFDLVISLMTLHNLPLRELALALREMQRVGRAQWVTVEAFRNEREKANLLAWQLTCQTFLSPESWLWAFDQWGYRGDYEFLFFE